MAYKPQPALEGARRERVIASLHAHSIPEPNSGCWLWLGATRGRPGREYGNVTIRPESIGAHVASWRAFKGAIGERQHVCHKCDVRLCVNPEHLWLGSAAENTGDMLKKGRDRHKSRLTKDQIAMIKNDRRPAAWVASDLGISPSWAREVRRSKSTGRFLSRD